MIIVAFGVALDHALPRPYHKTDKEVRPRRELSLVIGRLIRSRAIYHRRSYRVRERHRRSERAPRPPHGPSPLEAA
jgi:hypothetical protein